MDKQGYFAVVAGEPSGDRLGAALISALKKRYPDAAFVGIGGPRMIAAGCESLFPMERLAVMGFVEPLGRLPELFRIKRELREKFVQTPPLAFIGIDSPDFNLRLAAELHEAGVLTVHYVSPSVWAYRAKRIHKIKQSVDLMLTLFPFETDIYHQHAIPVRCVGHPLADEITLEDGREPARAALDIPQDRPVITLMPGSRTGEVRRLAADFLAAAALSLQEQPALQFLLPCSSDATRELVEQNMEQLGLFPGEQFRLLDDSYLAMAASDGVLMASGTATLEALLLGRPMVIAYRLAPLTFAVARRLVKLEHVGLPNLLAGKSLVPEYLQNAVTPEALSTELLALLNGENREQMLAEFASIHRNLRRGGSELAAESIAELCQGRLEERQQSSP